MKDQEVLIQLINCTESELSKYLSILSEILSSVVSVLWPGLYAFWYSSKKIMEQ